jgi:hypothetical protein
MKKIMVYLDGKGNFQIPSPEYEIMRLFESDILSLCPNSGDCYFSVLVYNPDNVMNYLKKYPELRPELVDS